MISSLTVFLSAVAARFIREEQGRARRLLGSCFLPLSSCSSLLSLVSTIIDAFFLFNCVPRPTGQVHEPVHRKPHESVDSLHQIQTGKRQHSSLHRLAREPSVLEIHQRAPQWSCRSSLVDRETQRNLSSTQRPSLRRREFDRPSSTLPSSSLSFRLSFSFRGLSSPIEGSSKLPPSRDRSSSAPRSHDVSSKIHPALPSLRYHRFLLSSHQSSSRSPYRSSPRNDVEDPEYTRTAQGLLHVNSIGVAEDGTRRLAAGR